MSTALHSLSASGTSIFWLTRDGLGEMNSTRIAFLPGGFIVVYGDLCPAENGVISTGCCGLPWFVNRGRPLTPSYLAEKFRVPSVFIAARAAEHLRDVAEEEDNVARRELLSRLAADADDLDERDSVAVSDFVDSVADATGSPDHAESFYGPDPRIMDLLVSIQSDFARLFTESP